MHTHTHTHTYRILSMHTPTSNSHSTIYREGTHYVFALSDKRSSYMYVAIPIPVYQKYKMQQDWEDTYRIDLRLHCTLYMCDKCWRTYKSAKINPVWRSRFTKQLQSSSLICNLSLFPISFVSLLHMHCTQYCKKPQSQYKFCQSHTVTSSLTVQSRFKLSQIVTVATDKSSCFPVDPLLRLYSVPYTTVQMLGLDDFATKG